MKVHNFANQLLIDTYEKAWEAIFTNHFYVIYPNNLLILVVSITNILKFSSFILLFSMSTS